MILIWFIFGILLIFTCEQFLDKVTWCGLYQINEINCDWNQITNLVVCDLLFYSSYFDFEDESYICYAFWVPYEVYIKDFSKFHHFTLVLSSWWFSIHLLELKIQMWRIPPCHTSKVASWHVDYWYELHLWSSLSKIWLKVSKTGQNSCYLQYCQFLPLFETLSQILLREDHKWRSYQ